jgi:hypothetical protein
VAMAEQRSRVCAMTIISGSLVFGFAEAVAQRRGVLSGGLKRVLGWLRTSGCVIVIRRC